MVEPFRVAELESGLTICFFDHSNRYFGDFHRVCIAVKIEIPQKGLLLSVEQVQALAKLKQPLCYEKRLERMGVVSGELHRVRAQLVDDFLTTGRAYLNRPDFAQRFMQKKLSEKSSPAYLRG